LATWQLRLLIWAPSAVALVLFLGTLAILSLGQHFIQGWLWDTLKDIGPTVAGAWVLVAGLLTLTASGIAVREARRENRKTIVQRRVSVIVACDCDLKSYVDRLENLALEANLREHIHTMQGSLLSAKIFRRNLRDDWFTLSIKDPVAISELGEVFFASRAGTQLKCSVAMAKFSRR
jgi:hypothetical protein